VRGWRDLVPPFIVFGLLAAILFALGRVRGSWSALAPDPCRVQDCFCEPFGNGLALQPANTYSNLGLLLVGLLAAWTGARGQFPAAFAQNANRMISRPACPLIFGATLCAAGVGSLFYHASLSRAGEWTDLVGIYLFLSFLLFYNLSRLVPVRLGVLAGAYIAANLVLGIQMAVAPQLQQVCFGLLAAGAIGIELLVLRRRRPEIDRRYLAAALACFAAGAALWALDGTLLPCQPAWPIQWHAIWHLLSAAAGGFLYAYYLSERSLEHS
jgi:hypothetical protein